MKAKFWFFIGALLTTAFASFAKAETAIDLKKLDPLQTCQTAEQIKNAQTAVKWVRSFEAWDLKTQSALFAQDFKVWHSSLAALAAYYKTQNPAELAKLPFPDGLMKRPNYSASLVFLAYSNDKTKWKETPVKLDCLDDQNIAVDINFSGAQVKRDDQGYILYSVDYGAPAVKVFTFDSQGKVKLQTVALDNPTSTKARAELAEKVKKSQEDPTNNPPLAKDERTKGTFKTYLQAFQRAFGS